VASKKSKKRMGKERLIIQLDAEQREILDKLKQETGASFAEIIRRLIDAKGEAR